MSWVEVEFESLYEVPSRNGVYKAKTFHGSGAKIVNMGELFRYSFVGPQEMARLRVNDSEQARFGLQDGDLLFARRSLVEAGAGKCVVVEDLTEPTVFESSLIRVRLSSATCHPRFYYYYFGCPPGRSRIEAIITGAAQKGIRGSELAKIRVHRPDMESQQRIADILSAYDDLIENNNRRMALLEEAIHLLYREWFVYLRFPGHDRVAVVDGVPDGWERTKLKGLATLHYGKSLPKKIRQDGSYPVYGSSGVVGTHKEALVKGPGLIVGRKGNVGTVFLSESDFFPIDTVYYVDREQSSLFLYACFSSLTFTSSDAAVPGLNRNHAYSKEVLVPPGTLRADYERYALVYWRQLTTLRTQNQRLREARDLLLPRLMNGSIAV